MVNMLRKVSTEEEAAQPSSESKRPIRLGRARSASFGVFCCNGACDREFYTSI